MGDGGARLRERCRLDSTLSISIGVGFRVANVVRTAVAFRIIRVRIVIGICLLARGSCMPVIVANVVVVVETVIFVIIVAYEITYCRVSVTCVRRRCCCK